MSKRGNQEPRLIVAPRPTGFDPSDGVDCGRFSARFGLSLDPWQQTTVETWMTRDRAGRWCANTWGVTVSRQNGKNGIAEAVELYGMVVLGLRFLHTAHEVKTARKAFLRILSFFDNERTHPELAALVKEIRKTNGQEAIVLHANDCPALAGDECRGRACEGGSVEFIARSKGSGRGFTVDVIVIDEAQDLLDEQLEALGPTISAAPSGDPATIYMGTPPKDDAFAEDGKGAPFARVRDGAVLETSKRTAWVEFSLDVDLDLLTDEELHALVYDDRNVVATNPALGRRILMESVEGEREKFSLRSFARERLNVWPRPRTTGATGIPVDLWRLRTINVADVPQGARLSAVGLDMDTTGVVWSCAATFYADGVHVELGEDDVLAEGVDRAVERLWLACRKRVPVVFPIDSGVRSHLETSLRARGMGVYVLNAVEQAQASTGLLLALRDGAVTHLDDPVLDAAVQDSTRFPMGTGMWRLGRSGELASAPLLAAACARHGATRWAVRPSTTGRRAPGRTAGTRAAGRRTPARR